MSNTTDTILGYNASQTEAVSFELQNTVMDLITLTENTDAQAAVDTVVTGLSVRIAILEGLITPEDAEKLVLDTDGNFVQILTKLQDLAFAKFFGA